MREDDVWLPDDLDAALAEPPQRCLDVGDSEVDERARSAFVEEEPHPTKVEEDEARRVEGRERLGPEQVRVERRGTAQVLGALTIRKIVNIKV